MSALFIKFLVLSTACGSISMTITKATVFNFAHEWLEKKAPFLEEMLSCPWCTSHWIALFLTLIYKPLIINGWYPLDYLVTIMVMVTVSAVVMRIMNSSYRSIMG